MPERERHPSPDDPGRFGCDREVTAEELEAVEAMPEGYGRDEYEAEKPKLPPPDTDEYGDLL